MRLVAIKLAGFKSFVDPTTIALPGRLIGIVGPNGCGKSNVIDAVRWVLGELKASALRGESMEDVIFNGAGERKPVSRASVELVFDNSAGRAQGPWSKYSELSVKRVLERNGGSHYYINHQAVRRRDILDLFLGTGLGPRAYAVIEQGMISRLIEAKPEELRVFLEEAAGVSRYRERRRETEARLADTRENLARVEDIRAELGTQLERLEAQAKVAARYRELEQARTATQALLLVLRREEALRAREAAVAVLAQAETELFAKEAELASHAREVEALRQAVFTANDAQHAAQGAFYEINAEVARTEQQLAYERERRARLAAQVEQLSARLSALAEAHARHEQALAEARDAQAVEEAQQVDRQRANEAAQAAVTRAEEALQRASERLAATQDRLAQVESARQLAQLKRANAERSLAQLAQRRERLEAERARLKVPESSDLGVLEEQLEAERTVLAESEREAQQAEERALAADRARATARLEREAAAERLAALRARHQALVKLQEALEQGDDQALRSWARSCGIRGSPLWRALRVEPGWDDAIEAVLRERLQALPVEAGQILETLPAPPARLTLYSTSAGREIPIRADGLARRVSAEERAVQMLLAEWLHGYRAAPDLATALAQRHTLGPGESWVTPQGHLVDAQSLSYFAPEARVHGATTREREIAALALELAEAEAQLRTASEALARAEERYERERRLANELRSAIVSIQQRVHALEVERMQLEQARARAEERGAQIAAELEEIATLCATEEAMVAAQASELLERQTVYDQLLAQRQVERGARNEAEIALVKAREAWRQAEHALRDGIYALERARSEVAELERALESNQREQRETASQRDRLRQELESILLEPIEGALQQLLSDRQGREQALRSAREAVELANARLLASEEKRLALEREFEPIRRRIEDARVRQSTAEAALAQLDEQLAQLKVDQEVLAAQLAQAPKPAALQAQLTQLDRDIAALGAVNLAAIEELEQARERKQYLDAQATDLAEAIATLEDAIRRIDRETRTQLASTYEQVNAHFGRLFPVLFGGGTAKLVLTGEEILDAGIQVIAQPPGKRNSSIHLLSGGEKALTAIALVFALFHLNPAPFCLLDEVDAPLDDPNTERFCKLVREMAAQTQFVFISHNKISMEMAEQLIGVTMNEPGVSRVVGVDVAQAVRMAEAA
ncbi:MAG: chromosome segregation protein SMC [Casimicrobiaceae bacterium]|nr:chromosome segregation protein SMC [Casimicrobiaceae bacterium]MCX8098246.1 chromosome segregation protein SMC [Casimicrobiaceae bacterium]MDW8311270.1 chromosome segregation protein SMC [Burkholderiales bacterium]